MAGSRKKGARQNPKIMVAFKPLVLKQLEKEAEGKGITVQELLRAIVVPDYLSKKLNIETLSTQYPTPKP